MIPGSCQAGIRILFPHRSSDKYTQLEITQKEEKRSCNAKQVRMNILPEVKIIEANSHDLSQGNIKHKSSTHPAKSSNTFLTFLGNTTSLSNHAQEYLFSLPTDISVLMLCEMHKEANSVHSIFRAQGFFHQLQPS